MQPNKQDKQKGLMCQFLEAGKATKTDLKAHV